MNHDIIAGEVAIPRTRQFSMKTRDGNREYRIFVAVPDGTPPASGFPVMYLLDANAVFGTMAEAVRVQGRRPDKTGVVPTVIVGIGYPTDAPFAPADRYYDYTLAANESKLPPRPGFTQAEHGYGGADAFLHFIETELKPTIEQAYVIDRHRQAIFGHSLGGLFVLHTLFTRPDAFQSYIAGSPSIHWNERLLLEEERCFVVRLGSATVTANVLLAAGEWEKGNPCRMNENAQELAGRLSSFAGNGLYTEYKEFEGEGHVSLLPALISRALRFSWSPQQS